MTVVAVKIKIMPQSPDTDLGKIQEEVVSLLRKKDVQNPKFEIQPIAFGLKALIVMFGWLEDKELEKLEDEFGKIKNTNSIEVVDIRRAIG